MADETPQAEAPPTATASESGDPEVQRLLAERQAAAMNGDDDALAAVDEKLVALGFSEYAR